MAGDQFNTNLCWLLSRASHTLTTELTAALEDLGISPRAQHVLDAALEAEHTQIELARIVGLDKTTMVVTLDELEAAGLAVRRPSPTDRRARVIAVTAAGREMVRAAREVIADVHEDVLATLPEDERGPFMASLATLVAQRLIEPVECAQPPRRRAVRAVRV